MPSIGFLSGSFRHLHGKTTTAKHRTLSGPFPKQCYPVEQCCHRKAKNVREFGSGTAKQNKNTKHLTARRSSSHSKKSEVEIDV